MWLMPLSATNPASSISWKVTKFTERPEGEFFVGLPFRVLMMKNWGMKMGNRVLKEKVPEPFRSAVAGWERAAVRLMFGVALLGTFSCKAVEEVSSLKTETIQVDAPFEMEPITIPDFSDCPAFSILDFGAEEGDKEKNNNAVAEAIAKANAVGGGVVVVPEGEWLVGKIHLKSNVNLHLEEGALLLFSEDPEDYLPAVKSSWEGMECYNYSPLIYAYDCTNVAITGTGHLNAKLDVWKIWYARPPAHMAALKRLYTMASTDVPLEERQMVGDDAHLRPQFIQFNRCKNVLLEGVSIENSPFWVIHLFLSADVVVRGVHVNARGHNNDGVDPEMCRNVLIEDCVFNQGDDAIAVKSGRNQDAWRLAAPSKNIVVRNCTIKNGHQLLAVGSELSGGVENVLVENCTVDAYPYHLCYIKTNERRGGYVKNIYMRGVTSKDLRKGILGIETDVLYQWKDLVPTYEKRLTPISDVYLEDVKVGSVEYYSLIKGQEELPIRNVSMTNVEASAVRYEKFQNSNVESFQYVEGPSGQSSATL